MRSLQNSKQSNNRDEVISDEKKEQQQLQQQVQQNHWLLSNLLPQGRSENVTTADNSPVRNRDGTTSPYPSSNSIPVEMLQRGSPQQKPVNLLPEVPMQTSRKLSDREQRDCDVIGRKLISFSRSKTHLTKFDKFFANKVSLFSRATDQILLLHRSEINSGQRA